jgi:hypothetical protein
MKVTAGTHVCHALVIKDSLTEVNTTQIFVEILFRKVIKTSYDSCLCAVLGLFTDFNFEDNSRYTSLNDGDTF